MEQLILLIRQPRIDVDHQDALSERLAPVHCLRQLVRLPRRIRVIRSQRLGDGRKEVVHDFGARRWSTRPVSSYQEEGGIRIGRANVRIESRRAAIARVHVRQVPQRVRVLAKVVVYEAEEEHGRDTRQDEESLRSQHIGRLCGACDRCAD
jgi:hypothetical protein